MTERVTISDIERISSTVSESLRDGLRVEAQRRNGYTALDLYDPHGMVDTLHIGTAREVYTYLQGMRRTLLIIGR